MPVSKTPLEYYHYYSASQRRVEQWVQDTGHQLQQSQGSQPNSIQWQGFLEDPCLATPISMSPLLDKAEKDQADAFHVHSHDLHGTNGVENGNNQRRKCRSASVRKEDDDSSRSRPRTLEVARISPKDDVTVAPSSSKHSKNSAQSGQTLKSKLSHGSSRKRRPLRKEDGGKENRSILVYVPYGIVPLIFAMATGSSPMSLAAASIILAGYFCLDYNASVLSYCIHTNFNLFMYRVREDLSGNRTLFAITHHLFFLSRYHPCFMTIPCMH